jgi:hypothetical protein
MKNSEILKEIIETEEVYFPKIILQKIFRRKF